MSYKVKKLPNSQVEITITVSDENMQKHYKRACDMISKDVKIKGFRSGHVPQNVLEQHVSKKYIEAQAQDLAIQKAYIDAVKEEKLEVISRPKVEISKDKTPVEFVAVVAVMPEVTVKGYESIKVKKGDDKVSDKEINEVIDNVKKEHTEYKEVERKAKKEDKVEVDFAGFDEKGKPVENTDSKNHPVILGSNTMIPGFEDELVGLKPGEEKEFDITFPKDYFKKDFQNKKLKFKTKVNKVLEPQIPELNKEFIKKASGQDKTVEEFKSDINDYLSAEKKQKVKAEQENNYIEELLKKIKVDLPPQLVEEEIEFIIHDVKKDIEGRGAKFEDYLKQAKLTMEDLRKKYEKEAEKRIKVRLGLREIINLEKIEVSDKELEEEFEKIKAMYPPKEHGKIEKDFKKGQLKVQLLNRLSLRKLFEKVLS